MFRETVNVCSKLSVLTSRMRTGVPTGTFSRPPSSSPFSVGTPSNVCATNAMSKAGLPVAWLDHDHAEQAAPHLLRGDLVGVVPERPDLVRPEAVGVGLARQHCVLCHAGDAVLSVRNVDAVPVDGHALGDVVVAEHDLHQVALPDAEFRARRGPVVGQRVHDAPRREADLGSSSQ